MMIGLMVASAIVAASLQSAAADTARSQLRTCIKQASEEAKKQKIAAAGFADFARQQCASHVVNFKSAVWAFDSRNKVSKRQSESDANVQIDDFLSMAAERYHADNTPQ